MSFTEKDRVPEELGEAIDIANELINSSYLLAARIALLQELHPDKSLPHDVFEEIEELNDQVDEVDHLDITFSGIGSTPVLLPDGEVTSMYGKADIFTGNLSSFDLSDPTDLTEMDMEDLDEYAEDDGALFVDNDQIQLLRQRLITPERGLRLFTEFFLESTGPDEISGASVRTPSIDHYAIIDSGSLIVDSMDIYREPECYGSDEIVDKLIEEASSMHNLLKSTTFRRRTRQSQIHTLEARLERLNDQLAIERFLVLVKPNEVYVPDLSHENYRMVRVPIPDHISGITTQCLRIDSLEHFALTSGSRRITQTRRMRDPDTSFCLVSEIDEQTRQQLNLPSKIIWVPVRPLGRNKRNAPGYVDPVFDGIFLE